MKYKQSVFEESEVEIPPGKSWGPVREKLLKLKVGDRPAFRSKGAKVFAGPFAGAIDLGGFRVEVLPKPFGIADIAEARELLFEMLRQSDEKKRLAWMPSASSGVTSDVLETVMRSTVTALKKKLESDCPRRYQTIEESSSTLRGRILFSQYSRNLPPQAHRIPVQYSPLTKNNELSQVVKSLALYISNRTRNTTTKAGAEVCMDLLFGVDDKPLSVSLVNSIQLNRLEKEWFRFVKLAELFAKGESSSPTSVGDSYQPTLMFPLNLLFESIVRRILRKHLVRETTCEAGSRHFPSLWDSSLRQNVFSMKPDILFLNAAEHVAAGDTKWKTLQRDKLRYGIGSDDLYQILGYMRRLRSSVGLLFFPRTPWMEDNWSTTLHVQPDRDEKIVALSVDIYRMLCGTAEEQLAAREEFADRVNSAFIS